MLKGVPPADTAASSLEIELNTVQPSPGTHNPFALPFAAAPDIERYIQTLGRTEDLRFAPSNQRLAVAAFARDRVAVFDVEIVPGNATQALCVHLTGVVELVSTQLNKPHGLDFLDDEHLVVANREGAVCVFRLPPAAAASTTHQVQPVCTLAAGASSLLQAPGSVRVSRCANGQLEILVCNNSTHSVSRHVFAAGLEPLRLLSQQTLLHKWLDVPDGVSVSPDGRWIAVSNHGTHNVLLFRGVFADSLQPAANPVGILRGAHFPHGLRFSPDGRWLFVADAGAPFLRVYASADGDWHGVRAPAFSLRIMDQSVFLRGRQNPQDGGSKGLDIDASGRVLVLTSQLLPFQFFDLVALQGHITGEVASRLSSAHHSDDHDSQIEYELLVMAHARDKIFQALSQSLGWRLGAPWRRVLAYVRKWRHQRAAARLN